MRNETEFSTFLKSQRRKETAIEQILGYVRAYATWLADNYHDRAMTQTTTENLESYVSWIESENGRQAASKPLWALRYYFDFIENQPLSDLAGQLRLERIKKKPFLIKNFRGVNPDHIATLDALYIENKDQLIDAARTPQLRAELAQKTGIPPEGIMELVKLCDLARLGAVRTVRARLYHDAGLTPEIIATWEPEELRAVLVQWLEENNFDGIAPTPKEVEHLVEDAKRLPLLVIYAQPK